MTDREIIIAVARSLYWGYARDTTGTPGKWSDLNEAERKVWTAAAKRAVRKIDEFRSTQPDGSAAEQGEWHPASRQGPQG